MIFNTKRHKLEFPFYIGAHILKQNGLPSFVFNCKSNNRRLALF
jgi:hypothetical protein